jgi:1-phosphatidylinositol phosphodiesterase
MVIMLLVFPNRFPLAGFHLQIVNATLCNIKQGKSGSYQMEWNPSSNIAPNSFTQFEAEFKETVGH